MTSNYYDILGVPETADQAEIRRAFRKKAAQYHPDLHRDDSESELERYEREYNLLTQAYDVLSDDEKRRRYDLGLRFGSSPEHEPFAYSYQPRPDSFTFQFPNGSSSFVFTSSITDPADLLSHIFGMPLYAGVMPQPQPRRESSQEYQARAKRTRLLMIVFAILIAFTQIIPSIITLFTPKFSFNRSGSYNESHSFTAGLNNAYNFTLYTKPGTLRHKWAESLLFKQARTQMNEKLSMECSAIQEKQKMLIRRANLANTMRKPKDCMESVREANSLNGTVCQQVGSGMFRFEQDRICWRTKEKKQGNS